MHRPVPYSTFIREASWSIRKLRETHNLTSCQDEEIIENSVLNGTSLSNDITQDPKFYAAEEVERLNEPEVKVLFSLKNNAKKKKKPNINNSKKKTNKKTKTKTTKQNNTQRNQLTALE